jgi:hypothetical protein
MNDSMKTRANFGKRLALIAAPILAALITAPAPGTSARGAANEKVRIAPRYEAAQVFRYRIQTRNTTMGKTTTPIENPEGESKKNDAVSMTVRLEVVGSAPGLPGTTQVRFRATFESASAQSDSDAFNPDAPSMAEQFKKAEGQSLEFTLQPTGQITDMNGLSEAFPQLSATDAVIAWAGSLATAGRIPREGILIGQKWNNERQLAGMPLAGLVWRAESTYSRDDVCDSGGEAQDAKPRSDGNDCAIVLTHFEIQRRGGDATPEDYRRNGLRTSGTWNGSGDSLDTISLATGYLENSTQTSTQNVDYEIVSAGTGSKIHRVSKVESQTGIRRLASDGG